MGIEDISTLTEAELQIQTRKNADELGLTVEEYLGRVRDGSIPSGWKPRDLPPHERPGHLAPDQKAKRSHK